MTWIQTFTGKKFSLVDPQPEDVDITDVVAALGNICRFGGHCRQFYSVLQHSVRVAELCDDATRYDGLMHDAAEAYYGDIVRPQKLVYRDMTHFESRAGSMYKFDWFTDRISAVVAKALGFSHPLPESVKHADNTMLATEARDIMGPPPEPWVKLPEPLPGELYVWNPQETYCRFVKLYHELKP